MKDLKRWVIGVSSSSRFPSGRIFSTMRIVLNTIPYSSLGNAIARNVVCNRFQSSISVYFLNIPYDILFHIGKSEEGP